MSEAILRMNPARTLIEMETPEGAEWGPLDWPEDQLVVCADPEGGDAYLAVLDGYEGLEANTIYKLVKIETVTEEDDHLGEDVDDDEDDTEDAAAV